MRAVPYGDFRSSWKIRDFVVGGGRPPLPSPIVGEEYNALMTQCWDGEPARRPSFASVVETLQRVRGTLGAGGVEGGADGAAASV